MRVAGRATEELGVVVVLELHGLDTQRRPARRVLQVLDDYRSQLSGPRSDDESTLVLGTQVLRAVLCTRREGVVFYELLAIIHLQLELVGLGVLVGGVVTSGAMTLDGRSVFGPGVEEAQRLRDLLPRLPRVVVDPRLLAEVERNPVFRAAHHSPGQELGYLRRLLRRGTDGLYFVDYLSAARREMDDPASYPELLEQHRQLVDGQLSDRVDLDAGALLWLWARRYHRDVVQGYATRAGLDRAERARLRRMEPSPLVFSFAGADDLDDD